MLENTIIMKKKIIDFLVLVIIGIINGLFSTGAGQILVFYYIYILKKDTKEAREKSLTLIPVISIPTMFFYLNKSNIEIRNIIVVLLISLIFGTLGNKLMKKINSKILNFVSGLFLIIFSAISLWRLYLWFIF